MTMGPESGWSLETWAAERRAERPDRPPRLGVVSIGADSDSLEPLRRACVCFAVYLEVYLLPEGMRADIRGLMVELSAREDLDGILCRFWEVDETERREILAGVPVGKLLFETAGTAPTSSVDGSG